jgi:hypothetical protein
MRTRALRIDRATVVIHVFEQMGEPEGGQIRALKRALSFKADGAAVEREATGCWPPP